jgi:MYXO-CTERM domain-containing protein
MRLRIIASTVVLAGVLAHPALVYSQTDPATSADTVAAGDREDRGEWGWLGLLGLAGLFGLRGRERDRNDVPVRRPV